MRIDNEGAPPLVEADPCAAETVRDDSRGAKNSRGLAWLPELFQSAGAIGEPAACSGDAQRRRSVTVAEARRAITAWRGHCGSEIVSVHWKTWQIEGLRRCDSSPPGEAAQRQNGGFRQWVSRRRRSRLGKAAVELCLTQFSETHLATAARRKRMAHLRPCLDAIFCSNVGPCLAVNFLKLSARLHLVANFLTQGARLRLAANFWFSDKAVFDCRVSVSSIRPCLTY